MRSVTFRGFSLVEVMVAMAVLIALSLAALPGLQSYLQQARLRDAGTSLLAHALFAQSEAMKRNSTVRVDVAGNSLTVRLASGDASEPLRIQTLPHGVNVQQAASIGFGAEGRPVPAGEAHRVSLRTAGSLCGDPGCPELHVDAGGAVRLCRGNACR